MSRKVCYAITSLSNYADDIDIAEDDCNRDHEHWLKKINLAVVTDQQTHFPLAFKEIRGSVNDASTLVKTTDEFLACDAKPAGTITDTGFWTETNRTCLTENGVKFMIPVPAGLSWSRALI